MTSSTIYARTSPLHLWRDQRKSASHRPRPALPGSYLQTIISNDPGMAFAVLSRANFNLRYEDEGFLGIAGGMNRLGVPATAALLDELDIIPDHLAVPMAGFWSVPGSRHPYPLDHQSLRGRLIPRFAYQEYAILSGLLYDLGNITALRIFGKQYTRRPSAFSAGKIGFHNLLKEELGS